MTLSPADETKTTKALDPGLRRDDEQKSGAAIPKRKLSYKDARELEQLPARIEALERDIAARTQAMHDPAFFKQGGDAIAAANADLAALQSELDAAYARWQTLEG